MMSPSGFVHVVADVTGMKSNVVLVAQPQSNPSHFFLRASLHDHVMLSGYFALLRVGRVSTGKPQQYRRIVHAAQKSGSFIISPPRIADSWAKIPTLVQLAD